MKLERHLGYMLGGTMVMWVQSMVGGAWTRPKIIVVKGQQIPIEITSKNTIYQFIENENAHKPSIASARKVLEILRLNKTDNDPNQGELAL